MFKLFKTASCPYNTQSNVASHVASNNSSKFFYTSKDPSVKICGMNSTIVDLPPIYWYAYDSCPTLLTVSNNGRSGT